MTEFDKQWKKQERTIKIESWLFAIVMVAFLVAVVVLG